jgi:hypothetical protein
MAWIENMPTNTAYLAYITTLEEEEPMGEEEGEEDDENFWLVSDEEEEKVEEEEEETEQEEGEEDWDAEIELEEIYGAYTTALSQAIAISLGEFFIHHMNSNELPAVEKSSIGWQHYNLC